MDLKILSLATDKTTDKLQECLQTLKTDDAPPALRKMEPIGDTRYIPAVSSWLNQEICSKK